MKNSTCYPTLFLLLILILAPAPNAWAQTDIELEHQKQKEMMEEQMMNQRLSSQLMMLIHNPSLRDELRIVEDQIPAIREGVQEYQRSMQEFAMHVREDSLEVQRLRQEGDLEAAQELGLQIRDKHLSLTSNLNEIAEEVLLPDQWERLQQITRQNMVKSNNPFGDEFGVPYALADHLELSREQKQDLHKTIEQARKEYYEKVAELKKQANDKIMAAIPAEKHELIKEYLGDSYDPSASRRADLAERRKQQQERWRQQQEEDRN